MKKTVAVLLLAALVIITAAELWPVESRRQAQAQSIQRAIQNYLDVMNGPPAPAPD
jgi:hypothetical protein